MTHLFGWMFVALAVQCGVNTYRHTTAKRKPSFFGGASATGQACLGTWCLTFAAASELPPNAEMTFLQWVVITVALAIFILGSTLEGRAIRQAKAESALASGTG